MWTRNRGGAAVRSERITLRHYLAITAFASLLYCNGLHGEFAYDDSRAIEKNPDILSSTPWSNLLWNDFWGTPLGSSNSHGSYRPVAVATFRLNYWLHGLNPFGYHLLNLVLHLTVTVLYTMFVGSVLNYRKRITVLSALLFASHPVHVESVTSIVGRADVGAALFYLLALMSYAKFVRSSPRTANKYLYASLCLAAFSMLTKEHGVTCLAVCLFYHLFVIHRFFPFSWRSYRRVLTEPHHGHLRKGLLYVTLTLLGLVALRLLVMNSRPSFAPADNPASESSSVINRTLTFIFLPSFNLWLLIYPRWLSFDWSMKAIPLISSLFDIRNLYTLSFYAFILELSRRIFNFYCFQSKTLLTSTYSDTKMSKQCYKCDHKLSKETWNRRHHWKHIPEDLNNNSSTINYNHSNSEPFSYENNIVDANNNDASTINNNHITERFKTPPTKIALMQPRAESPSSSVFSRVDCLALSMALMVIPFLPATNLFFYVGFVVAERILYIPSFGYCLFLAICIESLLLLSSRFVRPLIYFSATVLILSFSLRTLLRNVDWLTEENLYRAGIAINPPKAYGNLANILSMQGKKGEAEMAYRKALSYRFNMADVHYNLGLLLQEQKRLEEAFDCYKQAIRFRPRLAMAHLNMGIVLSQLGQKEQAKSVYRHCAELSSEGLKDVRVHETTKISALYNLGKIYSEEENYEKALKIYTEAVSRMPPYYPAQSLFNVIGEVYYKRNQLVEAEKWFIKSLKVKRDHVPAHLTYAKLLVKLNRTAEAESIYQKALVISSNDTTIHHHYAQFLYNSGDRQKALKLYQTAFKISPKSVQIVMNLANILRELRKNEEAEKFYELARNLRPNDLISYSNLGAIYHLNGKYDLAKECYLKALKLKPDDQITQMNLAKLEQVTSSETKKHQ